MGDWDIDQAAARKVEERLYKQVDPEREDTERLLELYFDPKGRHSGAWFERIPNEHGANSIGCHDFLAVTMLDLHIPALLARDLYLLEGVQDDVADLLDNVPDTNLWDATDDNLDAADELWRFLKGEAQRLRTDTGNSVPFGPARVSKLLARKRPHLIPITDDVVRSQIKFHGGRYWASYRSALLNSPDDRLVKRLESLQKKLRKEVPGSDAVTPLRILDAMIWIRGSKSKAAKVSCKEAGRPPS